MRRREGLLRLLAPAVLMLICAFPAAGQNVTSFDVDCRPGNPNGGTYTSIQQAIEDVGLLPVGAAGGPTNIHVWGECQEEVNLPSLDRVVIFSQSGDGGRHRRTGGRSRPGDPWDEPDEHRRHGHRWPGPHLHG